LGPFKTFLLHDANRWGSTHQNIKLTRIQLGTLLGGTQNKAGAVASAVTAFKITGPFPWIKGQSQIIFS
jgi:hypothetical protein